MKVNGNDPVFPTYHQPSVELSFDLATQGISQRAYIATAVLQGMLASTFMKNTTTDQTFTPADRAKHALVYADALIAELNK